MDNVLLELLRWTPSFAAGFGLNLSISLLAMLTGTLIGWLLACGRSCAGKKRSISCTMY